MSARGTWHVVRQGECVSSLALKRGLSPESVWNYPENASLSTKRAKEVLHPGDHIFLPERELRSEEGATEQRHRFKRLGVPERIRVQFIVDDKPLANREYSLLCEGEHRNGTLDNDGFLDESIPVGAREATVLIHGGEGGSLEYRLNIRSLNPESKVSGAKGRLRNLGLYMDRVDEVESPEFQAALGAFQRQQGLPVTGKLDDDTEKALEAAHLS